MYKKGRWIALVVLFALALVACAPPQMPTAVPTPALPVSDNSGQPIIQEPAQAEQPAEAQPPIVQPAEQQSAPAGPSVRHLAPSRIVIESIGLDYQPVPLGLDENYVPIVNDHDVGWFNKSAGPGEGENIVFWAHVLRFLNAPDIAAPFAKVAELPVGARITVYDAAGNPHNYTVKDKLEVTPDQTQYMYEYGREAVTLISCIGDNVIGGDGGVIGKSHRLIIIAEPE